MVSGRHESHHRTRIAVSVRTTTMSSSLPIMRRSLPGRPLRRPYLLDGLPWAGEPRVATAEELRKPEFLYSVAQWLRENGGPACGPDGITWGDLSPGELWRIVDQLS